MPSGNYGIQLSNILRMRSSVTRAYQKSAVDVQRPSFPPLFLYSFLLSSINWCEYRARYGRMRTQIHTLKSLITRALILSLPQNVVVMWPRVSGQYTHT